MLRSQSLDYWAKYLALQEAKKSISGTVVDTNGKPIPNVLVTLREATETTILSPDGSFAFHDVTDGIHDIVVQSDNYGMSYYQLKKGEANVRITLGQPQTGFSPGLQR